MLENIVKYIKEHKKFSIIVLVSILALVILFSATNCVESEAQRGYNIAKEDLEMSLYAPDSLEITKVYCYETILAEKLVVNPVDYVYKICYSAESKAGLKINGVAYYGYLEYTKYVVDYGNDSSVFDSEATFKKSVNIRK